MIQQEAAPTMHLHIEVIAAMHLYREVIAAMHLHRQSYDSFKIRAQLHFLDIFLEDALKSCTILSGDEEIEYAREAIDQLEQKVVVYSKEFEKMIRVNYYHTIAKRLHKQTNSTRLSSLSIDSRSEYMYCLVSAYCLAVASVSLVISKEIQSEDIKAITNAKTLIENLIREEQNAIKLFLVTKSKLG